MLALVTVQFTPYLVRWVVVAPEVSIKYLNSFTVKQQVSRASKQARQLRVSSTPMMVVDGKYIIESRGSYEKIMKVVDHVVELQRPNS